MKPNRLTLKDNFLFNRFLNFSRHELSVYAFENIVIWKKLFRINWSLIEDNLCVFFRDSIGAFLYLAPLGAKRNPEVAREVFSYLNKANKNKEVSRIENIESAEVEFYKSLGLEVKLKSYDYLCERRDLAALAGNKFKSKRSSYNYFLRHNKFEYSRFHLKDRSGCLKLFGLWKKQREHSSQDHIYQAMLEDSLKSLKILLDDYEHLRLEARVVKIGGMIKAFTFGFKLNADTFCILYEITDLSVQGLAQFIFRAFCSDLSNYRYINIMDDSGLQNLKKVKLSYKPVRLIPAYIATIKHA